MKAFWDLCADRSQGRIPWTAVQHWCEAKRIEHGEQEDFHYLVGRLDGEYQQWLQRKSAKPNRKPEALRGKP